jgi:hypothetical protein
MKLKNLDEILNLSSTDSNRADALRWYPGSRPWIGSKLDSTGCDAGAVAQLRQDMTIVSTHGGSTAPLLVDFSRSAGASPFLQEQVKVLRSHGGSDEHVAGLVQSWVNPNSYKP